MSLKSWVTWVVLAIALCACAGQRRFVTFERNELPAGFDATQKTALERVLIIVERKRSTQPTAAARGALEGAVRWLGKLSSAHVTADVQYASAELDADRLGEAIADEFIAAGHAVAAHLAADTPEDAVRFLKDIEHTGILYVTLQGARLAIERQDGSQVVKASASLESTWRLMGKSGGKPVATGGISVAMAATLDDDGQTKKWFADHQDDIARPAARQLAAALLPRRVRRVRVVYGSKEDDALARGTAAALKGEWGQARSEWGSAGTDSWKAKHNLAVACERAGDAVCAKENYRAAAQVAGPKEKDPVWERAIADMDLAVSSVAPAATEQAWFKKVWAVMPLANETNFVDAPDAVRRRVADGLRDAGYKVADLATTDKSMRELGISDGGQLAAVTAKDIGTKLDADVVFYGKVLQMNEVPLGVYFKRVIEIELRAVDAHNGKAFWSAREKYVDEEVSGKNAVLALAGQIAKSAAQRMKKNFFEREISVVTRRAVCLLPHKVGR